MRIERYKNRIIFALLTVLLVFALSSVIINSTRRNEIDNIPNTLQIIEVAKASNKPIKADNRYEFISNTITDTDINLLAKILWLESRGECDEGQQAVIEVIFNRVVHPKFPDTIQGVIYQRGQFSTLSRLYISQPTEREYINIWKVTQGYSNILDLDHLFFSTGKYNNKYPVKIGNHWFCKI